MKDTSYPTLRRRFADFVEEHLKFQNGIQDKMTKKRKGRRVTAVRFEPYFPLSRNSGKQLVLPPNVRPCERCAIAEYNKACGKQDRCMAYAFWATERVHVFDGMALPAFIGDRKKCTVTSAVSRTQTFQD